MIRIYLYTLIYAIIFSIFLYYSYVDKNIYPSPQEGAIYYFIAFVIIFAPIIALFLTILNIILKEIFKNKYILKINTVNEYFKYIIPIMIISIIIIYIIMEGASYSPGQNFIILFGYFMSQLIFYTILIIFE